MLITYPYRNNLSAYAAGFVDTESRESSETLATVPVGGGRAWSDNKPVHLHTQHRRHRRCGGRRRNAGLAAGPVGGGGVWPDNESTRRAHLAARTARGQAAAHGRTKQPSPHPGPTAPGTPAALQATTSGADGERAGRRPRRSPAQTR